jgi:hypothetical protein
MRDIYARAWRQSWGNSPPFDCSRSVSVFVRGSPLNTPRTNDTVATSGFPRLPLCFTRDWWTAKIGVRGLVTVPSLLAKR